MSKMKRKLPDLVVEQVVIPPNLALAQWQANVAAAALAFESRWTILSLQRFDPDLAANLSAQFDQWHEACFLGERSEIATQGAAMVRGYAAAVSAMEGASLPDDAYQLGICPKTGAKVAIGAQKAAIERVRTIHGQDVVWITPDEVAALFGSIEELKTISAIKQRFPGAEIIQRYQEEPAKADGSGEFPANSSLDGIEVLNADGDIAL